MAGAGTALLLLRAPAAKPWRSAATYDRIEAALRAGWPGTVGVEAGTAEELRSRLEEEGGPEGSFAFNIGEYLDEERRQGFLPALLEAWRYPHLGSAARTVSLGLDKGRTQALLRERGVPTPPSFAAGAGEDGLAERAGRIGYPLIVKPLQGGGHLGISADAVVGDAETLERAVRRNAERHGQRSLVERYLDGPEMREFSVGVVGNRKRFTASVEVDWQSMPAGLRILSHEAAQRDLERVKPVRDPSLAAMLGDLATRTFDAVGALDYARVDLRMDGTGCYVLEINILPGLGPDSFLPAAARDIHGISYDGLVRLLASEGMRRAGIRP